MARNQPNPSEAAATMHRLLAGGHIAHVIRTAAKLGLADHLEDDKPLDVQSIAKATSTHAPSLARVMRALAAIGIVHETKDHQVQTHPTRRDVADERAGLNACVGASPSR